MTGTARGLAWTVSALITLSACESSHPVSQPTVSAVKSPAVVMGDLPVWEQEGWGNNPAMAYPGTAAGFVHFPGAIFRRDPSGDMLLDRSDPNATRARTPGQPYLYGATGSPTHADNIMFDRIVGRWLPVSQTQVSADGLQYAYLDHEAGSATPQRLHLVDVRSAVDRIIYRAVDDPLLAIVGVAQGGILLVECRPNEVSGNCWGPLWRVDSVSGILTKVSDRLGKWVIGQRTAWVGTCWPGLDPWPCFGGVAGRAPNQLIGVDLTTRSETLWLSAELLDRQANEESGIYFLGLDGSGLPLVAQNSGSPDLIGTGLPVGEAVLYRISQPNQKVLLFSVPVTELWAGFDLAFADQEGIWLIASYIPPGFQNSVLFLYTKQSGGVELSHNFWDTPVGSFG